MELNSLISWLIARSGHDAAAVALPRHGRAPGWDAGLVVAARGAENTLRIDPPPPGRRERIGVTAGSGRPPGR